MPLDGGEESEVLKDIEGGGWAEWASAEWNLLSEIWQIPSGFD